MSSGRVLYEQNADAQIAPASITKIMTLFLLFDAIHEGRLQLHDPVLVSSRAAATGGSRMGLKTGERVSVGELIKGIGVVSGNDAAVAAAEHLCGDVQTFVRRMNSKARELGMYNSMFMTPNGLPAAGQLTTARDLAKLSIAYLRRYPESLSIHSMTSYTYNRSTHRNANRLLGQCEGVDGLKTGFVCASGYNLAATAKRGDTRLLAVVLGAQTAGIRARETERLIEAGFQTVNGDDPIIRVVGNGKREVQSAKLRLANTNEKPTVALKKISRNTRTKTARVAKTVKSTRNSGSTKNAKSPTPKRVAAAKPVHSNPVKKSSTKTKVTNSPKVAGLKEVKKTAKVEDVTRPSPSPAKNGIQSKTRSLVQVQKKR
jgi:D-alanyl-D-alanine carboxypeptidase